MSKIHILPNLRKGLSKHIQQPGANDQRARFKLSVTLSGQQAGASPAVEGQPVPKESIVREKLFTLAGPIDVKSIDSAAICQVVPANKSEGSSNAYMPYVEFYEEDFPWKYTPQVSSAKLEPWLLLLVCKENEFVTETDTSGCRSVTVTPEDPASFYPAEATFHKLAHVQVTTPDDVSINDTAALLSYIQNNPDDGVSRLFCSRPLETNTKYTAFLVPAFELGRLSGLGQKTDGVGINVKSWNGAPASQKFPIYYSWGFKTGGAKFLELARKQRFISDEVQAALPDGLKADITETGLKQYKLSPVFQNDDKALIDIPVALVKNGFKESDLTVEQPLRKGSSVNNQDVGMDDELKSLLEKSPVFSQNASLANDEDPWIVPPVYGARHTLAEPQVLGKAGSFLKDLNLRFRNRAAAGMGVSVVKRNQEVFTNRAWGMIEEVNALNQRIREYYEALKLNGAADKKTNDLRYYRFTPATSGLQTDAAIRVANAQSGARIDAVKLADNVADSGNPFSVFTSVMTKPMHTAGITNDEIDALTDRANWEANYGLIMNANKKLRYLQGKVDYFSECLPYYKFLSNFMVVEQKDVIVDVEQKKVRLKEPDAKEFFSFRCDNMGASLPKVPEYDVVSGEEFIRYWIDDPDIFLMLNKYRVNDLSLEDFLSSTKYSKGAYESMWGENFAGDTGFLHQICLPVNVQIIPDEDRDKRTTYAFDRKYDNGVFMKQGTYDRCFKAYPKGVAIKYYKVEKTTDEQGVEKEERKEQILYILPENSFRGIIADGGLYKRHSCGGAVITTIHVVPDPERQGSFIPSEDSIDCNLISTVDFHPKHIILMKASKHLVNPLAGRYAWLTSILSFWPEDMKAIESEGTDSILVNNGAVKIWVHRPYVGEGRFLTFKVLSSGKEYSIRLLDYNYDYDYVTEHIAHLGNYKFQQYPVFHWGNIYASLLKVQEYLRWYDSVAWTPNVAVMFKVPDGVKTLTADDLSNINVNELIESINDSFDGFLGTLDRVRTTLYGDPQKGIAGIIRKESAAESPAAAQPEAEKCYAVDADEVNRERLVDLSCQFAEKGITLDLSVSNFDGKYPIMAYPIFPDPTSFYLRELSERFLLPAVDKLALNSISCFITNPIFEEAFLSGMNTEMGRELLWREYPTDERGSYFRKFWDQVELPDDFANGYFDVKYLHNWKNKLGSNHEPGKGQLVVFVVRSELMRMYPQTGLCLARKASQSGQAYLQHILSPTMTGWISDDVFMAGFDPSKLTQTSGVYLAFVETDKSQRFDNQILAANKNKPDTLSSNFATNRSDNGSVWGIEIDPKHLKISFNS